MMKPKVMKNDELVAASHPALISAEDVMINDELRWILHIILHTLHTSYSRQTSSRLSSDEYDGVMWWEPETELNFVFWISCWLVDCMMYDKHFSMCMAEIASNHCFIAHEVDWISNFQFARFVVTTGGGPYLNLAGDNYTDHNIWPTKDGSSW